MKHPAKEDLVSLLYEELPSDTQSELKAHLQNCAECQAQMTEWQQVQGKLRAWSVPRPASRSVPLPRLASWAAAALFMICVGFAVGRFTGPTVDAETIRASLEPQLRQALAQELNAAREADRRQVITMLTDIEEQRMADYTQLRKDLETVAVIADEKLTHTERVLRQANLFAQGPSR